MHLLLIEDDPTLHTTLQRSLTRSGMHVDVCADGALALDAWQSLLPDVVVLDLSLPKVDGLDILESARKAGLDTPVLVLTARGTVGDRIIGLNAGADDYLTKPFDLDELEARVRALHRRQHASRRDTVDHSVQWGCLRYDRDSGAIYDRQSVLDLTPRELTLLRTLIQNAGHAVAKDRLFEMVFPGEAHVQVEAIEVVVYRLRKKLKEKGVDLVTLRGLGYLLKETS
jgi:two-component system response regulator TctD